VSVSSSPISIDKKNPLKPSSLENIVEIEGFLLV
jgi:hypothetical protein